MDTHYQYQHADDLVNTFELGLLPSELHGMLCGLSIRYQQVSDIQTQMVDWLAIKNPSEFESASTQLIEAVLLHLINPAEMVTIALPTTTDLSQQAEGLATWCNGFLSTLALSLNTDNWADDCKELINDIVAISQLDHQALETTDTEERELFELVEFTKIAYINLYLSRQEHND